MAFEGIIPAVTTPFTADDQVDVAGAEGEHREADRGRRARLRRHRHDGRGRLADARGARAGRPLGGRGRRRPRAGHGGRLVRLRSAVARSTRPTARPRARSTSCRCRRSATAPTRTRSSPSTPSSPPAACRSWPTTTPRPRASTCPRALIARIYEEVDAVIAIKECSGDARRIPALLHLDGDLEVDRRRRRLGARRASPPARSAGSPASACSPRARPSSSTRPCWPTTWRGRATCTVGCSPSPAST